MELVPFKCEGIQFTTDEIFDKIKFYLAICDRAIKTVEDDE